MAGIPPGALGPGAGVPPPQRPPMGVIPGLNGPLPPPGGAPPPPAPPPMPPPPPPGAGGLGPASPLTALLSDLSPYMSPGWQQIDLSIRALRTALRSVDFQKTPAVVAVVQSVSNTLSELLSHYTSGTAGAPGATAEPREGAEPAASDADSQPAAEPAEGGAE